MTLLAASYGAQHSHRRELDIVIRVRLRARIAGRVAMGRLRADRIEGPLDIRDRLRLRTRRGPRRNEYASSILADRQTGDPLVERVSRFAVVLRNNGRYCADMH
jgi:hypothetical protein